MMTHSTQTVHLVDDNKHSVNVFGKMIDQLGWQTIPHHDAVSFLKIARKVPATGVLLNWEVPGPSVGEIIGKLKRLDTAWSVVVFCRDATIEDAVSAMRAGAIDFLTDPVSPEKLATAFAYAGSTHLGAPDGSDEQQQMLKPAITQRQFEVLQLLVDGHQNKSIAFELQISERTVEAHRARMMRRLEIQSFAELIALAVRSGITRRQPGNAPD